MQVIRKRYRVLLFALLVAAFVVPVGFALSLETTSKAPAVPPTVVATTVVKPVMLPTLPDGAKLFLVGTVLFGLAAAVRKTI